jgi:pyocin large subunit-like protein
MIDFRHKIISGFLFFTLLGAIVPCCHQPLLWADETTVVQAGHFAPGELEEHYLKHGYQFGQITQEEYLHGAQALLNAAPGTDVLEKVRFNGDVEHFRVSTGEFAVMTQRGRIRTYFKTDYEYWLRR